MARYTSLAEVREAPDLDDSNIVSDAVINLAIDAVEESIDNFTQVSWSKVDKSVTVVGNGTEYITVPVLYVDKVKSLKCGRVPVDHTQIKVFPGGKLNNSNGWTDGEIYTIKVSHGKDEVPNDVKYIAKIEAQRRARVIMTKARQRNSGAQVSNEHGQFTYPNWSGKFGPTDDAEVIRILNNLKESSNARFSG